MLNKNCIYFSRFKPTTDRGGGSRRAMQVLRTFNRLDPLFVTDAEPFPFDRAAFKKLHAPGGGWLKKSLVTRGEYPYWSKTRRDVVYRLRNFSAHWARLIDRRHSIRLVLMDDPIYFAPLAKKLFKLGVPVAAVCHNIESLVASNVDPANRMNIFKRELDLFDRCETVITISREDTVLLNTFNTRNNAVFFPYYPVEDIRRRLLAIRKEREKAGKAKKNFLIMGTVNNNETREGMLRVIRHWESAGGAFGGKLLVAGYSTDTFLKDLKNSDNIEFLGPLDNETHDKRLGEISACICYQERGGGALTRICEMLIAGVPVAASTHAARSYYNIKGVTEFRDLPGLGHALKNASRLNGHIPIPDPPPPPLLLRQMETAANRDTGEPGDPGVGIELPFTGRKHE